MFRNLLAIATFSALCIGRLAAGPIDPYAPDDFPDPTLSDHLAFVLPIDLCFENGGHNDCLENAVVTATGPVTDSYPSDELDSFSAQMFAEVYQDGVWQDSVTLDGNIQTVDDRTDSADWLVPYDSSMTELNLSGVDDLLGEWDLGIVPDSTSTGSTTISPQGSGYQISSFFDVFTEITIDGGNPVPTSPTQTEFDLAAVPEPSGAALAGLGIVLLLAARRRRAARRINAS